MKKLLTLVLLILVTPYFSDAANITFPYSNTFDCDEWSMVDDGTITGCQEVISGAGILNGVGARIFSTANMTNGIGGLGFRQMVGDGTNQHTGQFYVTFSGQDEMWFRWYLRNQSGFTWGGTSAPYPHYSKLLYVDVATAQFIIVRLVGDEINVRYNNGTIDDDVGSSGGEGWPVVGDGNWHSIEAHVTKTGIYQVWVDGDLVINSTTGVVMPNDFTIVEFGTNQDEPANGSDYYIDTDDIVISTTGYIGPVSPEDVSSTIGSGTSSTVSAGDSTVIN